MKNCLDDIFSWYVYRDKKIDLSFKKPGPDLILHKYRIPNYDHDLGTKQESGGEAEGAGQEDEVLRQGTPGDAGVRLRIQGKYSAFCYIMQITSRLYKL